MGIRHYLGLSEYGLKQKKEEYGIYYEPDKLINAHMLVCGMSGVGKTFQVKRMIETAARTGVIVDVFDVHDELDNIPGAASARYSQATRYGYNPLVLDTDPHSGGVNRQVEFLVGMVKETTSQFGSKQEAVLRNLLIDVYMQRGIFANNARSWQKKTITEREYEALVEAKKWSELRDYYPTMTDLMSFAKRKAMALLIGGDNKCVTAFESLTKLKGRLNNLMSKWAKAHDDSEIAKIEGQITEAKAKCVETYAAFVDAMQTGREVEDVFKYDSVDVLTGVMQRLEILSAAGIFRANAPDFGGSNLRVHQTKSLTDGQQVMFTKLRLREVFEECKRLGPTATGTEVRRIVFLDEAPKYFNDDKQDIVNIVAREARKFGLGLWCAAQEPNSFPSSFLTNCGCKVLLGIDASFWKGAISNLRITEDTLKFVKAKEVMTVKLQKDGQADPPFINVIVPNPNTELGRKAAQFEAGRRVTATAA
jgi:hypothetical protein